MEGILLAWHNCIISRNRHATDVVSIARIGLPLQSRQTDTSLPISTISQLREAHCCNTFKKSCSQKKCRITINHGWPGCEWTFRYQFFAVGAPWIWISHIICLKPHCKSGRFDKQFWMANTATFTSYITFQSNHKEIFHSRQMWIHEIHICTFRQD